MPYVAGVVYDDTGAPVGGRTVRVYRRDTGVLLGGTTTASGTAAGDSDFGSVVLLLHGDGSNGSTTIVDSSSLPKAVTASGNAAISTAQSKFGGASIAFDGTEDYLTIPASTDFDFGSGDFTLELFFRTSQTTSYTCLVGRDNGAFTSGAYAILLNGPGSGYIQLWNASYSTSSVHLSSSTGGYNDDSWHHLAISRSGSTVKMFVDGVEKASSTWAGAIAARTLDLVVGDDPGYSRYFNGYIDDLRITKGVARYTADFTVPSAAFPDAPIALSVGGYAIPTSYTGEVNVVTLDAAGGTNYNDLILRTTPV